ncbi:MAG TPA: hypothetical protein VN787_06255 [Steroidobacteraceae bacterium]|nr:hypothetical protein [Steroidobacteraceae bacterium]
MKAGFGGGAMKAGFGAGGGMGFAAGITNAGFGAAGGGATGFWTATTGAGATGFGAALAGAAFFFGAALRFATFFFATFRFATFLLAVFRMPALRAAPAAFLTFLPFALPFPFALLFFRFAMATPQEKLRVQRPPRHAAAGMRYVLANPRSDASASTPDRGVGQPPRNIR